jgi:hypothetical protein
MPLTELEGDLPEPQTEYQQILVPTLSTEQHTNSMRIIRVDLFNDQFHFRFLFLGDLFFLGLPGAMTSLPSASTAGGSVTYAAVLMRISFDRAPRTLRLHIKHSSPLTTPV